MPAVRKWFGSREGMDTHTPYAPKRLGRDCDSDKQYRDDNLRRLGYRTYRQYLKSDLWYSIKTAARDATDDVCQKCRITRASHIYPGAYDKATLQGRNLWGIRVLCHQCWG